MTADLSEIDSPLLMDGCDAEIAHGTTVRCEDCEADYPEGDDLSELLAGVFSALYVEGASEEEAV